LRTLPIESTVPSFAALPSGLFTSQTTMHWKSCIGRGLHILCLDVQTYCKFKTPAKYVCIPGIQYMPSSFQNVECWGLLLLPVHCPAVPITTKATRKRCYQPLRHRDSHLPNLVVASLPQMFERPQRFQYPDVSHPPEPNITQRDHGSVWLMQLHAN
jgi:hypothetical protein